MRPQKRKNVKRIGESMDMNMDINMDLEDEEMDLAIKVEMNGKKNIQKWKYGNGSRNKIKIIKIFHVNILERFHDIL